MSKLYPRMSSDSSAIVVLNNADAAQTIDLRLPGSWLYRNAVTSKTVGGHVSMRQRIEAKSEVILLKVK